MAAWRRFRGTSTKGQTPFGPRARRAMQRANQLLETGDHANAAVLLEEIALNARDRGMLRWSPFLHLRAARAHLMAGQVEDGARLLRDGLRQLAETRRWPILRQTGGRVVEELQSFGQSELAAEIEGWLAETLPAEAQAQDRPRPSGRVRLPLKCEACGATVRPDEVEWVGSSQAECAYCGSLLRFDG